MKFTLRVPSGSEGGYYACVVFDALLKGKKEESITTPFEIPVIMSVPPKLDLKGEVSDLEVSASAGKAAAFTAYFKNTGNIHIKPKGIISLQVFKEVKTTGDVTYVGKAQWEKVAQFPFEDVSQYVLPGGIRKMEAGYAGALGAGKYTAEIGQLLEEVRHQLVGGFEDGGAQQHFEVQFLNRQLAGVARQEPGH